MSFKATTANVAWAISNVPDYLRFRNALRRPRMAQLSTLRELVGKNRDSAFGRKHHFSKISDYKSFAERLPVSDYSEFEPWIDRIIAGEQSVLTSEPVRHLIPTSGSSGARKLIPFTGELQREFNAAIGPWFVDLVRQHPSIAAGAAYWSISPATQSADSSPSAVPIGFEDDSEYIGGARKQMVDAIFAVPNVLRLVSDLDRFRHLTLLALLRNRTLRFVSIWHPTFLSLLLDALPRWWEQLIDGVATGQCPWHESLPPAVVRSMKWKPQPKRAAELREVGPYETGRIWSHLAVISCWADAHAAHSAAELQSRFPMAQIQGKGLLATEAVVTIPFSDRRPIALCSHFFEFISADGCIRLADELKEGENYEVIVSTGGGLWRYRLGDRVLVDGFLEKTPSLQFIERTGNVCDLRGEKLSEHQVILAFSEASKALQQSPHFIMLAPEARDLGVGYTCFVEGEIDDQFAERLEIALRRNPNYAWCRELGQLAGLRTFQINRNGHQCFLQNESARGRRLGEIKPCALSSRADWASCFDGAHRRGATPAVRS